MIEYPTIIHSSKAPHKRCIAFEKLDGSNIRCKWTQKKGFNLFGSRTQMLEESHPILGQAITIFKNTLQEPLEKIIRKNFPNEREVIVFGEYFGPNSFAGWHQINDPKSLIIFDVLVGHKNRKFLLPQEFIKLLSEEIEIPRVIYEGNLNDQLIVDVKSGKYDVDEGVICKDTERTADARGNVWMAKIKTEEYFKKLKNQFGENGFKKYW